MIKEAVYEHIISELQEKIEELQAPERLNAALFHDLMEADRLFLAAKRAVGDLDSHLDRLAQYVDHLKDGW